MQKPWLAWADIGGDRLRVERDRPAEGITRFSVYWTRRGRRDDVGKPQLAIAPECEQHAARAALGLFDVELRAELERRRPLEQLKRTLLMPSRNATRNLYSSRT